VTPDLITLETVLRAADSACYEAKSRGRNCVATYEPSRRAA
jgi:GGDEF domain-containing protein